MLTSQRSVVLALALAAIASSAWTGGMPTAAGAPPPVTPACVYCPGMVPEIEVSSSTVDQGQPLTVVGRQFTPRSGVELTLHSQPVLLATVHADPTGRFAAQVTIPDNAAPGSHTIEALDLVSGDVASAAITVEPAVVPLPPGGGGLAGTGVAIAALGGFGVALVLFGQALTVAGRRRRVRA